MIPIKPPILKRMSNDKKHSYANLHMLHVTAFRPA
jgi:hypothetical protein